MSNRTASASRAVNKAWERERQLVLENKGTRDWTPEQQQAIIDKGRAYDDNGRAFEGHHMKSVEAYPDYQDLPDNIQFLTKSEHLNAHGKNFQNPTNGNYDYITKKTTLFGEEELIPCEIINLSDPIIKIESVSDPDKPSEGSKQNTDKDPSIESHKESPEKASGSPNPSRQYSDTAKKPLQKFSKTKPKKNPFSVIKDFVIENPDLTIGLVKTAGQVLFSVVEVARSVSWNRGSSRKHSTPSVSSRSFISNKKNHSSLKTSNTIKSNSQPINRSSPHEHIVPGHSQRYHTKDGIITKVKAPYSRGKKDV